MCYGGPTSSAGNYQSYDQLGRVTSSYQQTDSINYGFGYGYNLASKMTSETYPSGRQVITEYDSAGRAAGIRAAAVYYAGATASDSTNRIQYAPQGAVSTMKLGNGKWEHTNFNNRLQPKQIGLGTSGTDSSILKLDYEYTSSCQTGNNGNVLKQTINASGLILTQNYCYDALNRLSSASENSGASWSQTYGFDRYGNRWVSASPGFMLSGLTPTSPGQFNTANNRLFASGYDNAGNQTGDALSRSFTYDAENRQLTFNATGGQYFYDGDGHRVKKVAGGVTTGFVYNAMGQLTAEYTNTNDTTPPVGRGGTSYLTSDHLGSTRVVTKSDGSVKARYDYLPFGEELGSGIGGRTTGMGYGAADSTKQKFTQKERDSESGLDYFGARYYGGAQGRFTSTDPNAVTTESFVNPQRWNLYIYVNNSPLAAVDPNGGDGEGKGGDKVISVFLQFQSNQRGTTSKGTAEKGPNWQQIGKEAKGYQINIYGDSDVGGSLPATKENFESAHQNSEVVIYAGHSFSGEFGVVGGQPQGTTSTYTPVYVLVGETAYGNGGSGIPAGAGYIPTGPKPESSASVVCTFACNSSVNPDYVKGPAGQLVVTVNSGKDGLTAVGTLEKAAAAFARAYVSAKGSSEEKAKAGVKAAQGVIKGDQNREWKNRKINSGDKVVSERRVP